MNNCMMNVISSVLKVVAKNSDGFDDIEQFWNATEKLTFPLENRIKTSLFSAKTVTPVKPTPQKADSDVEFNYDTSSTISDDEEDDDDEESESESEDDRDDHNDEPSLAEISTKSGKDKSALSSGIKSSRSSIQSSVYSPLNASLGTIGLSPLGTTDNSIRQSIESGISASNVSGRDSLLSEGSSMAPGSTRSSIAPGSSGKKSAAERTNTTNKSRRSEAGMDISALSTISAQRDANESDFDADRSGDMNETGMQSEFGFGQKPPTSTGKGRRGSNATEQDSLATPAGPANKSHHLSSPRGTDGSINLLVPPSATKGGRSVERSNLRVSFSNKPELEDLSPIAGSPGTMDSGLSKRNSASFNSSKNSAEKSRNTTNNSVDVSRSSNKSKSRNTTTSSVNSTGTSDGEEEPSMEQSLEHSAEKSRNSSRRSASANNSAHSPDDNNDFGDDYVDDYAIPSDAENEEQDISEDPTVSRILSQTANTPTPSKSLSRSAILDDSGLQTPYSEANTSTGGSSGRGRGRRSSSSNYSMISTPGSNEFVRGYRYPDPDASVMRGTNDDSTDEEELNTTDNTTPGKNNTKKKRHTVTDGEDDELDVSNEAVSISFIDKDFLETISSGNKKYQHGREELKKHRPRPAVRRSKLYNSDDENAASEEEDSKIEDGQKCRRSKRATKGQRFAYWKGERPIYEEGTIVGFVEVDPTPQKRKRVAKVTEDGKANRRASKKARAEESDQEEESGPSRALPAVKLPKHVKYIPRADAADSLEVWDDVMEGESTEKIFCPAESLQPATALPRTAQRPAGKDKVGFAAHSFNVPEVAGKMSGWISGFIELPPDAIKDAEGVGRFTQVFFVSDCQDGALEVGLADPAKDEWVDRSAQRVLLKKGDCFYVPPGNIYRLENHSTAKASKLFWMIVKPLEETDAPETGAMEDEEASIHSTGSNESGNSQEPSPTSTGTLLSGRAGRHIPIRVERDM